MSHWLAPLADGALSLHRVSDRVNKPDNNERSLIEPLAEPARVPVNLSFDF